MGQNNWSVNLGDKRYAIEFQHNEFTGKEKVFVNGQLKEQRTNLFEVGSDIPILLDYDPAMLHIRPHNLRYRYDLSINGQSVTTGQPVPAILGMEWWMWAFIVANFAGLIIAVGGLPAGIAGMGSYFCISVARDPYLELSRRIGTCVLITLCTWGAIILLAGGVGILLGSA